MEEQIEILRRIAERGLTHAQECADMEEYPDVHEWSDQIDLWQHMLDEIERTKVYDNV